MRKRRLPDESVVAPITSGPAARSSSGTRKTRWGATCAGHRVRRRRISLSSSALGALEALLEALDLSGGVDDVLRAGEERMALVADLDAKRLRGRPDAERVATSDAVDLRLMVLRVNLCLHGEPLGRWPGVTR